MKASEGQLEFLQLHTSPCGNALRKAYIFNLWAISLASGDVLLFYRSTDSKSVCAIGIVEEVRRSDQVDDIVRWVGRRTACPPTDVAQKTGQPREALAIRFRKDRCGLPAWELKQLIRESVLTGPPQQIMRVATVAGATWVRN